MPASGANIVLKRGPMTDTVFQSPALISRPRCLFAYGCDHRACARLGFDPLRSIVVLGGGAQIAVSKRIAGDVEFGEEGVGSRLREAPSDGSP